MWTIPIYERRAPKREVCFLIGKAGAVLWSDAGPGPSAMPDSRARWEAIWSLREELEEIAHSHPHGPLAFSTEDRTTIDALDAALGRRLRFSVVAPNGMVVREGHLDAGAEKPHAEREPWWAALLRLASGIDVQEI